MKISITAEQAERIRGNGVLNGLLHHLEHGKVLFLARAPIIAGGIHAPSYTTSADMALSLAMQGHGIKSWTIQTGEHGAPEVNTVELRGLNGLSIQVECKGHPFPAPLICAALLGLHLRNEIELSEDAYSRAIDRILDWCMPQSRTVPASGPSVILQSILNPPAEVAES